MKYAILCLAVAQTACATAANDFDAALPRDGDPPSDAAGGDPVDAALPAVDAAGDADAPGVADAANTAADASPGAYRATIAIDGIDDFPPEAALATTTSSYTAHVAWDDENLYVGYSGPDIAGGDPTKWLFVYLDVDPGAATGAAFGEQYNNQRPAFPTGFGAERYFRWKASNDFQDVRAYERGAWTATPSTGVATYRTGAYVETAIPLALLGAPASIGVVTFMLDEQTLDEWTWAGLYAASFTDGYYDTMVGPIPIGAYLQVDFASPLAPNDPGRRRP
jgi:hypothetical protein